MLSDMNTVQTRVCQGVWDLLFFLSSAEEFLVHPAKVQS